MMGNRKFTIQYFSQTEPHADLRAVQPYYLQTWQTAILLADSMAILLLTNIGVRLVCLGAQQDVF